MDIYKAGECEVHLRKGPQSKCLKVTPSNRCAHFLKWDGDLLLGLRKDMLEEGWEIEDVVQLESAADSRAKSAAAEAKK